MNPGAPKPTAADLAELVRLPAVLSVPGDVLSGAALAGTLRTHPARTAALIGSSCLLYLGGMALNDVADHEVDAIERPHRPIPSGRVSLRTASRIAHLLMVGGMTLAAAGGRRSFAMALPLASAIYAYDLTLKDHPSAPIAMATCRVLDVLQGASTGRIRDALPAAAVIGTHTAVLSKVSGSEVEGATPKFAAAATAGFAGVALAAVTTLLTSSSPGRRRSSAATTEGRRDNGTTRRRRTADASSGSTRRTSRRGAVIDRVAAAAILGSYTVTQLRAGQGAIEDPSPPKLQKLVGTSVLNMVPLQAATVLGRGHRVVGAALAAAWPLARYLSRRKSVT